jgi:hypothetical protein
MQLRRPFVLRHRITGAIKLTPAASYEDGGLWEMLLTDGSREADRLASMEESSPRVRSGKKQRGRQIGREWAD